MPRHPIELAKKQYEELPAVLKQALFSAEIAEQMFEIGKKFGLTIEKTGVMAEETGYIMLGLTRPNELVANLANELAISTEKAQDIAAEINHEIFFPLREELKRTHDFDMEASQIASAPQITTISGMQMPPGINLSTSLGARKTLVEEKSPLVSDLTRVKETSTPKPTTPASSYQGGDKGRVKPLSTPAQAQSFQPPASPTGRIADLQKMTEKPPLPVGNPITPPIPAPKPLITKLKEVPKIPTSFAEDTKPQSHSERSEESRVGEKLATPSRSFGLRPQDDKQGTNPNLSPEPWEKDLEKEVSSLLKPLPLDLRSQQKPEAAPIPAKIPPIDLRKIAVPQPQSNPTPPVLPRMTPQMIDLTKQLPGQNSTIKTPANNAEGPTLLEEKLKEAQTKPAPLKSTPDPILPPNIPAARSEVSPETAAPKNSTSSDPYREPIEEDQP